MTMALNYHFNDTLFCTDGTCLLYGQSFRKLVLLRLRLFGLV